MPKLARSPAQQIAQPAPVADPGQRVDVKRAFLCLFKQKGWAMTVLLGSLFMFIPVVGPIAFQGFLARVLKYLVMTGDDTNLPKLEGFGDLMSLGIMPFVVAMLWTFPIVLITYVVMGMIGAVVFVAIMVVAAVLGAAGVDPDIAGPITLVVAILLGALSFVMFYLIIILLAYPYQALNTMVEITGKLEYAWNFKMLKNYMSVTKPDYRRAFIGMMVGNLLMVTVVMILTIVTLGIAYLPGLMLLTVCLGVAGAHLRAQMYRIYLARGGEPLPMDAKL